MDQITAIILNYLESGSIKAPARRLKISKNTVREYLRRAQERTTDLSELLSLDADTLGRLMYESESLDADRRAGTFQSRVEYWLKELARVGVTRQLLWQEYRQVYPDGFGAVTKMQTKNPDYWCLSSPRIKTLSTEEL